MSDAHSESEASDPRDEEILRLREENERLRHLLALHRIPVSLSLPDHSPQIQIAKPIIEESKEERARKRVALFRDLFRGREDVYARRWEKADGRSGYAPADLKDWRAINASKPEDRKRIERSTRKFLPLTEAVIQDHLLGKETIGIYPLLADETCWFLAVDFDKKTWAQDSREFLETCRELSVPAVLERSRSGNGAHVWIFFECAIPASTARKLGCAVLTKTMERRHELGLDSYDRLFPNQDTMPKGGFGNLIALPLQLVPRKSGNSVFVDSELRPYPDQWEFLSTVRRMPSKAAEDVIAEAQRDGDLIGVRISVAEDEDGQDPWNLPPSRRRLERKIVGPLPESAKLIRANLLYIEKQGLPPSMLNRLLRLAAFQNPEFYKAQAMRLPTYAKPRVIACGQDFPQHIAVPRGCLTEVLALLKAHEVHANVLDERCAGISIAAEFSGELRPMQEQAGRDISAHDEGILCAPTAFGKTAVASWLIAKRKVNTLILVHRQQLLDQWQTRLAMFLSLPDGSIGHIGGGKAHRTGRIDVAVIQSLYQAGSVKDFVAEYGQVIVDECHHISAFTFEQVMKATKAKYIVGLTATPTRKDGHHPIVIMQCGPVRFSMSARAMTEANPFEHRVLPRHTDFEMPLSLNDFTIQDVYGALWRDELRNEMIAGDITGAIARGCTPLLLTNRTDHLQHLADKLAGVAKHVFLLKGGMGKRQRREIAEAIAGVPDTESRLILATGSYIGEGFDDARLDTLFLVMPISWKGTLQQYVGRLHRLHDNKKFVQVYDYIDDRVPMLARMYERRLRGYRAIGYSVQQTSADQDQNIVSPRPVTE